MKDGNKVVLSLALFTYKVGLGSPRFVLAYTSSAASGFEHKRNEGLKLVEKKQVDYQSGGDYFKTTKWATKASPLCSLALTFLPLLFLVVIAKLSHLKQFLPGDISESLCCTEQSVVQPFLSRKNCHVVSRQKKWKFETNKQTLHVFLLLVFFFFFFDLSTCISVFCSILK